jgi:hypothetical protein
MARCVCLDGLHSCRSSLAGRFSRRNAGVADRRDRKASTRRYRRSHRRTRTARQSPAQSEAGEMVAKTSAADVSAPSEVPAADRPAEASPTEVSAAEAPTEMSPAHAPAVVSAAHPPAEVSAAHPPAEMSAHPATKMSAAHAAAPMTTASAASPRERIGRDRRAPQRHGNNDHRYSVQRKFRHGSCLSVRDDFLHLFRAAGDTCLWRLSPACGDRDASRAAAPAP